MEPAKSQAGATGTEAAQPSGTRRAATNGRPGTTNREAEIITV
ncbi:hypothetical protein [Synechocystis sp. LKSZ1]